MSSLHKTFLIAIISTSFSISSLPVGAWPWADYVEMYNPGPGIWQGFFRDETRVIGQPFGGDRSAPNNDSVITLGDGGFVTLRFYDRIYNDPRNPYGMDFIIYGNAMFSGGNPALRFQEPAFVEVSKDNATWYLLRPNILPSQLKGATQPGQDTGTSATVLRGYADTTPTLALPQGKRAEEFYTVPDRLSETGNLELLDIDANTGGGDPMDLSWAVVQSSPGVPAVDGNGQFIPVALDFVRYVRITDAVVGDSLGALGEVSAEIDAVAIVIPPWQSMGEALRVVPGRYVRFENAIVTRVKPTGEAYIQALDRSCGVYLVGRAGLQPGNLLKVQGFLRSDTAGKAIEAFFCDVIGNAPIPEPLTIKISDILQPSGLNPDGLLIRTFGRVQVVGTKSFRLYEPGGGYITVFTDYTMPSNGQLFRVQGVIRRGSGGGVITVNYPSDVTYLAPKL